MDEGTYNSKDLEFTVKAMADNTEYDGVIYNKGDEIVVKDRSILELTYSYSDKDPVTIDAYQTTWWDSWGPTVIMLLGSAIIMIFLFKQFFLDCKFFLISFLMIGLRQ